MSKETKIAEEWLAILQQPGLCTTEERILCATVANAYASLAIAKKLEEQ